MISVATVPRVCRDPDDDHVLGCAVAAGADLILSGDSDLLALEAHEGIRILKPAAFLQARAKFGG